MNRTRERHRHPPQPAPAPAGLPGDPRPRLRDRQARQGHRPRQALSTSSGPSSRPSHDFERDFPSLCFALATGVGKTRLMGAFIAYLHRPRGSATSSSSPRT